MKTEAPPDRRKFADDRDELDYLYHKLLYWLYDSSEGKQNTLAFLDRTLNIGVSMLKQGKR